jgi:tripartite-type tricarboxylate transporter receptor subunit TctC
VQDFFKKMGADPGKMKADEFDSFFRKETDRLGKLVSSLGFKSQ